MTEQNKKKFKTVPAMDMEEYKKKIKQHRHKVLRRILFVVLSICLSVAALALYLSLRHYDDFNVISSAERADTPATIFAEFKGNILKYSNDGALYIDTNNDRIWNQTYEMSSPAIDICGDYLAVYDKKGTKIYIMNTSGPIAGIETTMEIQQVSIAAQGTIAVLMGDRSNSYLVLYDKSGTELVSGAIYGEDGGYPIAIALSNDAIKLAVSMLDINDGNVKTTIAFYNFGSVGENEIDRIVAANSFSDMVIPELKFISNDRMVAYADSEIILFEGTQKPKVAKEIIFAQEAKSIFYNSKYMGVVFSNRDEEMTHHMTIYDMHGSVIMDQDFSMEYSYIGFLENNEVCILKEHSCDIYTVRGIYKFHYDFDETLYKIISGNTGLDYTLLLEGRTEKIRLK